MAKDTNRHFSEVQIRITNKYEKMLRIINRKLQIKVAVRCHCLPIRVAKI